MAQHRAGDRRILSISIPEDLAIKLDGHTGKGREEGRSATITRLLNLGINTDTKEPTKKKSKSFCLSLKFDVISLIHMVLSIFA